MSGGENSGADSVSCDVGSNGPDLPEGVALDIVVAALESYEFYTGPYRCSGRVLCCGPRPANELLNSTFVSILASVV